ncbi:MAG: DUF4170 domain-containing protein [Dehalococcoidia bacterium]
MAGGPACAEAETAVAYYVVGGEYKDTTFRELVTPAPVAGPFESYLEAYEAWRDRARATVDQAYARFQIVQTMDAPPVDGLPGSVRSAR